MAEDVYKRQEDTRLTRRVALKFIPAEMVHDQKSLDRFVREARAASQLNHPGICTIHDIDDNNGHPFIVMEKLQGVSLKERMRGKSMEVDEILDIGIQVADALAASHAKGDVYKRQAKARITPKLVPSFLPKVNLNPLALAVMEEKRVFLDH